eukprot:5165352-Amphidinium_carterae.1
MLCALGSVSLLHLHLPEAVVSMRGPKDCEESNQEGEPRPYGAIGKHPLIHLVRHQRTTRRST